MNEFYTLGIDIGSTTAKLVLRRDNEILFQCYERHFSQIKSKIQELLQRMGREVPGLAAARIKAAVSGSAGMGLAQGADLPFVQEVFATSEAVKRLDGDASCVIELGGEDAKIIFFDSGIDERMNGSCAGGTGAFIDQMATLLNVTVEQLDQLSLSYDRIYPIAARCGVFAKSDIQPLLNQGAKKEDIAASIYQAVVNQTVTGLAQGRKITGKVLFLGGPLYYCKGLRKRFQETLALDEAHAVFPEYGRFSVSIGAAMYAATSGNTYTLEELLERISAAKSENGARRLAPLFASQEEYEAFAVRHARAKVPHKDKNTYFGNAYLGIDCGSTTTKLVLIAEDNSLLYSFYSSNKGNPVELVRQQLEEIYAFCGNRIQIRGSAVTGYGEELIQSAFSVDYGLVETMAHFTAAKYFMPDVDFILDIGGQDIKCFRIHNGAIDSIMLNEACSSGCGSFLDTFARALGCSVEEFAQKGLFAKAPADLGSRCTVFMNSSVKQAQKDGASVEDISAGLSISVVKNAVYKVIRASSAEELGKNIVVQGGTFYNDGVLRAFEKELGREVVRPEISGLMGAYGAALYSKKAQRSTLIEAQALKEFFHHAFATACHGCANQCHLTVNSFSGGKKFISGNQCEKGAELQQPVQKLPNLYETKRKLLYALGSREGSRGTIGLPMALGMYELLPLWEGIFSSLGFQTVVSKPSTRSTYEKGQFSIPSDTACYPAKIMHGHVLELIEQGVQAVFYPRLTYNINEKASDNFYNCPVVAYYSDLLAGNVEELQQVTFLDPYLNLNNRHELAKGLFACLRPYFDVTHAQVKKAVCAGFAAYNTYRETIKREGKKALAFARENGRRIMILAGRPYHIDPEIGHGIDRLAASLGFVVVSEDSVCELAPVQRTGVLNQWTYHARLYRAARFAAENDDVQLVQLVSFGCGIDAITSDEVRSILEKSGKLYTQLKIDEITNLGAVKIRLRSLLGALEGKEEPLHGLHTVHQGNEEKLYHTGTQHAANAL